MSLEPRLGLPDLGVGVGLRIPHYAAIFEQRPAIDWLEIISENFMVEGGRPLRNLDRALAAYRVVQHGVSLSIGGADPLDRAYLRRLKALVRRTGTPWVSDHLCWTGAGGTHLHDLLPLPYTEEALRHVVERCRIVQDVLETRFCLENVSSYMTFRGSGMPEWEFVARVAEEADVGLLLDVNNVFVSASNHGFDARAYVDAMPAHRVVQIHLAGHTDMGRYIIDTHTGHVADAVWALYRHAIGRTGSVSTLIEWDDDIPPLEVLLAEAALARSHRDAALAGGAAAAAPAGGWSPRDEAPGSLAALQAELLDLFRRDAPIDEDAGATSRARAIAAGNARVRPEEQVDVYRRQVWMRHRDALAEDLPGLAHVLGADAFEEFVRAYLRAVPPRDPSLRELPFAAPAFAATHPFPEGVASLARAMLDYELALIDVFDGADPEPLDPTLLAAVPAEAWPSARLALSPVVRRLVVEHPVHTLRRAVRAGEAPPVAGASRPGAPLHLLVFRKDDVVCFEELDADAAALLDALAAGMALGPACEALAAGRPAGEVERVAAGVFGWFRRFAELGVFAGVSIEAPTAPTAASAAEEDPR